MLNPLSHLLPPLPSPTNSSITSSDLDTESTGSFFRDRSITLGTLMGVSFPSITFRASSQHHHAPPAASTSHAQPNKKRGPTPATGERRRKRIWWRLCRDDRGGGDEKPGSLREYLEVERRFEGESMYGVAAELEELVVPPLPDEVDRRMLFSDGRVLPPAENDIGGGTPSATALCRFSVSLNGMCNGGVQ